MLTPEERKQFKHYLIDEGITMKEFCEKHDMNYGSFRNAINGFQVFFKNTESVVRGILEKRGAGNG